MGILCIAIIPIHCFERRCDYAAIQGLSHASRFRRAQQRLKHVLLIHPVRLSQQPTVYHTAHSAHPTSSACPAALYPRDAQWQFTVAFASYYNMYVQASLVWGSLEHGHLALWRGKYPPQVAPHDPPTHLRTLPSPSVCRFVRLLAD